MRPVNSSKERGSYELARDRKHLDHMEIRLQMQTLWKTEIPNNFWKKTIKQPVTTQTTLKQQVNNLT